MKTSMWVAGALLLVGVGCTGEDAPSSPVEAAPVRASGAQLYANQNCALCHGKNREGASLGPALEPGDGYWTVETLSSYLEDPRAYAAAHPEFADRRQETFRGVMPGYPRLAAEERERLARWLLGLDESGE